MTRSEETEGASVKIRGALHVGDIEDGRGTTHSSTGGKSMPDVAADEIGHRLEFVAMRDAFSEALDEIEHAARHEGRQAENG